MISFNKGVLVAIALLFGESLPALSQGTFKPGYIRTLEGSIDYGYIEKIEGDAKYALCRFKEFPEDPVEEYRADQVKGYGIEKHLDYRSMTVIVDSTPTQQFFESQLTSGKAKLFSQEGTLFVSNDSKNVIELTKDYWKETLTALLADCSSAVADVDKISLSQGSIKRFLKDYNLCVLSGSESFKSKYSVDPKIKVGFAAAAEYYSQVPKGTLDSYLVTFDQFHDANPVKIGITASKSLSAKWVVQVGLNYKRRMLSSSKKQDPISLEYCPSCSYLPYPITRTTDLQLNYNEFEIPVNIAYNIKHWRSGSWFVETGASFVWNGSGTTNADISTDGMIGYSPLNENYSWTTSTKSSPRIQLGTGYMLTFNKTKKLKLEVLGSYGSNTVTFANTAVAVPIGHYTSSYYIYYPSSDTKVKTVATSLSLKIGFFFN